MNIKGFLLLIIFGTLHSVYAAKVEYKGIVKTDVVHSDSGVGSYSNTYSHVAPTRALRTDRVNGAAATGQQTKNLRSESMSFQTAQSRFSFHLIHGDVKGVFEFDLIDGEDGFTNQTAIQSQGIRTRLATLYYSIDKNLTLFAGQKWTTVAGIISSGSYNIVGNGFQAGNTGFLAEELGIKFSKGDWDLTAAITGKGRNNGTGVNYNELGSTPGFATDIRKILSGHVFGVAGHFAKLNFEDEASFISGEDKKAYLTKAFSNLSFGSLKLSLEYYYGQSLNNMNALGVAPATALSSGSVTRAYRESGYFTALSWKASEKNLFKFGHGSADVESSQESTLSEAQLSSNAYYFASYTRSLTKKLSGYLQLTQFESDYGPSSKSFGALISQLGMMFKF